MDAVVNGGEKRTKTENIDNIRENLKEKTMWEPE